MNTFLVLPLRDVEEAEVARTKSRKLRQSKIIKDQVNASSEDLQRSIGPFRIYVLGVIKFCSSKPMSEERNSFHEYQNF